MLTYLQAAILGGFQGISELFPISSLGHSTLLPALLGWQVNEQDPYFLIFLVATHLATAIVLFLFYLREWMEILKGIVRSLLRREINNRDASAKVGWLLVVGTIPAGILGLLFQEQIQYIFLSPKTAALFLIGNGILLFLAERLRRRAPVKIYSTSNERLARLTWREGFIVGTLQSLALLPGFSRTGASLAGGLLVGLSHEDALRFSFLLATPIITAAAVLKIPPLFAMGESAVLVALLGSLCAAFCAYLSVKFLTKYFQVERRTLTPFALYCLVVGIGASLYLL